MRPASAAGRWIRSRACWIRGAATARRSSSRSAIRACWFPRWRRAAQRRRALLTGAASSLAHRHSPPPRSTGRRPGRGSLQPARWESYLIDACARQAVIRKFARRVGVRTIAMATALYVRGRPRRSPIDIVGFPSFHRRTSAAASRFGPPTAGCARRRRRRTCGSSRPADIRPTARQPGRRDLAGARGTDHPGVKGTVVYEAATPQHARARARWTLRSRRRQ